MCVTFDLPIPLERPYPKVTICLYPLTKDTHTKLLIAELVKN